MMQAVSGEVQNEMVLLTFTDGQTLRVPIKAIEGIPLPGASVSVLFAIPGGEDAARQALAKNIVNELIGGNI